MRRQHADCQRRLNQASDLAILLAEEIRDGRRENMDPKYLRHGLDFALGHFVEECGEALAAAGKSLRWGLDSVNPEIPPEEQETNVTWLSRELTDLEGAIARLRGEIGNAA